MAEKMKKESSGGFGKKFKEFMDKSVAASKQGFKNCGEKITDFGDKSVQKIELSGQKSKLEKLYRDFGKAVFEKASNGSGASVSLKNAEMTKYMEDIKALLEDVKISEEKLDVKSEKAEDAAEESTETEEVKAEASDADKQ